MFTTATLARKGLMADGGPLPPVQALETIRTHRHGRWPGGARRAVVAVHDPRF
jgi:hypothetical protein